MGSACGQYFWVRPRMIASAPVTQRMRSRRRMFILLDTASGPNGSRKWDRIAPDDSTKSVATGGCRRGSFSEPGVSGETRKAENRGPGDLEGRGQAAIASRRRRPVPGESVTHLRRAAAEA